MMIVGIAVLQFSEQQNIHQQSTQTSLNKKPQQNNYHRIHKREMQYEQNLTKKRNKKAINKIPKSFNNNTEMK